MCQGLSPLSLRRDLIPAWSQGFCRSQKVRKPEGKDENLVLGDHRSHRRRGTLIMRAYRACGFMGSSEGKAGNEGRKGCSSPIVPKETVEWQL